MTSTSSTRLLLLWKGGGGRTTNVNKHFASFRPFSIYHHHHHPKNNNTNNNIINNKHNNNNFIIKRTITTTRKTTFCAAGTSSTTSLLSFDYGCGHGRDYDHYSLKQQRQQRHWFSTNPRKVTDPTSLLSSSFDNENHNLLSSSLPLSGQSSSVPPMASSSSSSSSSVMETATMATARPLTIGILRETYNDWERRTPLCPHHVQELLSLRIPTSTTTSTTVGNSNNNDTATAIAAATTTSSSNLFCSKILVQPSSRRCFSDKDYQQAGAIITDDLSSADIILGVKRPIHSSSLLPKKTYIFFSHVIKGQEDNMELLQTILKQQIQLLDYECIVSSPDNNGNAQRRLVAFGKYAGLAGMIDTFYPLGRRLVSDYGLYTPFLHCPLASMQQDLDSAKYRIQEMGKQISTNGLSKEFPIVICITGGTNGRVFGGAMEIMDLLPYEQVSVQDLPNLYDTATTTTSDSSSSNNNHTSLSFDPHKVYLVTPSAQDMYQRRRKEQEQGNNNNNMSLPFSKEDWKNNPSEYESKFATKIAPYIHAMVNCIYWDPRYARLLTKDETQHLYETGQDRLLVVSDISCDINGSIEFLDRTCTIAQPFFQYNPLTREEVCADIGEKGQGITVMGTDILPAELPKESSGHFGNAVVQVLKQLSESRQRHIVPSKNHHHPSSTTIDDTNKNDIEGPVHTSSSSSLSPPSAVGDLVEHGPLVLSNACITTPKGKLAPRFQYLDSFLQMKRHKKVSNDLQNHQSIKVLLNGHLFDSGLINIILDTAEHLKCGFHILNCRVNRGDRAKDVALTEKSIALIQFYSSSNDENDSLSKLEDKIQSLIYVMDKAEASMKILERIGGGGNGKGGGDVAKKTTSANQHENGSSTKKRSPAIVESQEIQKVLVLGSGRVSMSLVDLLGRSAQKHVQVASDNEAEARAVAKLAKEGNHVGLVLDNTNSQGRQDVATLSSLIADKDIVISLLPAPMHAQVAEECIRHKTNLVTASYESPEMKALDERAKQAGIIIMNEVGLDPGLDHMSAMKIIDDVEARGGTIRSFQSVCGGLPAPEAAYTNPLRYKFSWSPKGVISASQNSARYRWENEIVQVDGHELMQSAKPFNSASTPSYCWPELEGQLECLPNRDSLKYEDIYKIHNAETLFRGTLRFEGFCSLMGVFQKMGLFKNSGISQGQTSISWNDVLVELMQQQRKGTGDAQNIESFLLNCARGDREVAQKAKEALYWLGMMGDDATMMKTNSSIVDSFCTILESKLQYANGERDMVAMHTAIEAVFEDENSSSNSRTWKEMHQSSLLAFGDESMSAMCRTVGFPAAAAADLILSGKLDGYKKGLALPTDKQIYLPILSAVEKEGISFIESVKTIS